ncbi:MAG: saccharopine dehydrogenase NADP-binding domain-containing protein [Chloroherpetonaceae bacterium]|nr:saccharopine dehydrogenase NADP-binding domain-containing protein [Chloroherpetonaceae bacterium]MDW8438616.1 saccharopine dehydrogenase C-terminal domain-containing protein [Chloroherpetonaceae bacterium]
MKHVLALGAGMVGRTIAQDLANDCAVTVADISVENLSKLPKSIRKLQLDVTDEVALKQAVKNVDLVVGAVPGFLGFQTARRVIEAGKNLVDISFFAENCFDLDDLAKRKRVTAVVDCGVAPGLGNIVLGYWNKRMTIQKFICYVGGLPTKREYPFEYKSPFSPVDVIEEYARPARLVENGKIVAKPALSEPEIVNYPDIGSLEAFNTDGLRSLLFTMRHIPEMKEKTLRYVGHSEKIKLLQAAGFFSEKEITVGGAAIKPRDFTSKILFEQWKLGDDDDEFTLLELVIEGKQNGKPKRLRYFLLDRTDHEAKQSSMSRTTGFTCAAVARLVLSGKYKRKGISPPEFVGENEACFNFVRRELEKRKVKLNQTEE